MKFKKRSRNNALRGLLLAALACALALPGWSQAPPQETKTVPRKLVERKNRAPVSKEILRVKLPRPVETTLPNGLTVLILEDHRFPVVTVRLEVDGAGPLFEPANRPGLANVTAQMLREGTTTRSSKQIAEQVDQSGATLMAFAGFGSGAAVLNASGLSDNFDQWFALATDVLLHPTFPADELAKLKQRLKPALMQQRAQPGFLANEMFSRAVYGSFPASVVSATPESIDALTSEILTKWHHDRYAPQNAILGIAGDVRAAELVPKLTKWLAEWPKTDLAPTLPPGPTPTAAKKVYLVDRPGSVQTTLAMGNIGVDRRDPDYIPLTVLNQVLGEGPGSRLFMNLREEKGYTYGVYSAVVARKYRGPWRAGGDLRTAVTEGAMTEFVNELSRLRNDKVPEPELDEAKRAVVASFALSLESPAQLLGYAIERKIYGFPADYWDTYPTRVAAVTADDVQRVAQKYINPETMQVIAVGDGDKIKTVLEKYGPVEAYDTSGKPAAKAAAAPTAPR